MFYVYHTFKTVNTGVRMSLCQWKSIPRGGGHLQINF